jgi:hypothetical protein
MTDCEIKMTFRRIKESGRNIPEPLQKLFRGLQSWHHKTGGLSEKQIQLLRNIEKQLNMRNNNCKQQFKQL